MSRCSKDVCGMERISKMTKKSGSDSVPHMARDERFKYAIHNLDLSRVKLSESPLDDYQRLFFATLLSRPNVDQRRNIDVKRATYKSNIAESFACPSSGAAHDAAVAKDKDTLGTSLRSQGKKVLDCFEYQFPDVDTAGSLCYSELSSLSEAVKENLGLKDGRGHLLKGSISTANEESLPNAIALPAQAYAVRDSDERATNANSLTKNQQFKLRKQDHSLHQNSKLINPNNCVLWTHGSGYVFLTGIWRLYQDVMRGLTSVPRLGEDSSERLQNICKEELNYMITSAFYESSSSPISLSPSDRRKRRQSAGSEKISSLNLHDGSLLSSDSATVGTTSLNPHYTDLHWNSLSRELKQMMCDTYRNHLINERGFNPGEIATIDYTEVVKRIRGGYIKIQGTWLPFETARLLCVRFCYPIRYLLVPIFGPLFPKECEEWYTNVQQRLVRSAMKKESAISDSRELHPEQRRRKRRKSTKSEVSKPAGNELLNAFQNLLDISRHPVPIEAHEIQARSKSLSCAPDYYTPLLPRRVSSETLPPISTVMQFISPRSSIGGGSEHSSSATEPENVHYATAGPYPRQSGQLQSYPNPTVQTLSHLASFYNTHGHRYSYPGNIYMSHQKPVLNRSPPYSSPDSELSEYQAKAAGINPAQKVTTGFDIPSYEPLQRENGRETRRWFSGSGKVGSNDGLLSPKTVSPGQKPKRN
ncbi:hypothetical protein HG536_0B03320 [Torulaspora globosa]|uniref:HTH APSES-type domain-containing protein n=1 Tax=Torulaspora globosa TaxID=48254 RepID=A0A7G3ZD83_9SACH|nr:uncharacterized protein HG536_0B03320 [Torulaspora globosa]QLL31469.1 hypothetical protein HG536_0B03320 [Torulaspora globosa]